MPTIDNEIYDHIHGAWWSDDSFMALLRNSVNPPRFAYFRDILTQRLGVDPRRLKVLDVGCGGGLLSEQFAAIGCTVTGIDRSAATIAAARAHAQAAGAPIEYRVASGERLPFDARQFDVVCCCDVLEHVDDMDTVIGEISRVLKPGGIFFFDTINRTLKSRVVAIKVAQDWPVTRFMPRNVHVWDKFIRPAELAASFERHGLAGSEFAGLSPARHPLRALAALLRLKLGKMSFAEFGHKLVLRKSRDLSISYMGFAVRALPA
jgi:2-polyprenyl-6-hydroxyphenyl methylase/3-demethylubiquinone-9 3-methyltransferase